MAVKASNVVVRWMNQACGRCLDAWRAHAAEEARKRAVMDKIVSRMHHRGTALAWDRWVERVEEAREERGEEERRQKAMTKIIMRLRCKVLFRGFGSWRVNVSMLGNRKLFNRAADLEQVKQEKHKEARRRLLIANIVKRMLQSTMFTAVVRWIDHVEEKKTMSVKMTRVLTRWTNQVLASFYGSWRELFTHRKLLKCKICRVLIRLRQRCVTRAFMCWHQDATACRRLRVTAERVLLRFINASLMRALRSWKLLLLQRQKQGHRGAVFAQKFYAVICLRRARYVMRCSLVTWIHRICQKKRLLHAVGKIVQRCRRMGLVGAMRVWQQHWYEQTLIRHAENRIMFRWQTLVLAPVMGRWKELWQLGMRARRTKAAVDRAAQRKGFKVQRTLLYAWSSSASQSAQICRCVDAAFARVRAKWFRRIALSWMREYTARVILRNKAISQCIRALVAAPSRLVYLISGVFGAWKFKARSMKMTQARRVAFRKRWILHLRRRMFTFWFEFSYSKKVLELFKKENMLLAYVNSLVGEVKDLQSLLRAGSDEISRWMGERSGEMRKHQTELEASLMRETQAAMAIEELQAKLLADNLQRHQTSQQGLKAIYQSLCMAQQGLHAIMDDATSDLKDDNDNSVNSASSDTDSLSRVKESIHLSPLRGLSDFNRLKHDLAGSSTKSPPNLQIRLIPSEMAQEKQSNLEEDVQQNMSAVIAAIAQLHTLLLARVKRQHAKHTRTLNQISADNEALARDKVAWSEEKVSLQSHCRYLQESLDEADKQVASLRGDMADLVQSSKRERQILVDSLRQELTLLLPVTTPAHLRPPPSSREVSGTDDMSTVSRDASATSTVWTWDHQKERARQSMYTRLALAASSGVGNSSHRMTSSKNMDSEFEKATSSRNTRSLNSTPRADTKQTKNTGGRTPGWATQGGTLVPASDSPWSGSADIAASSDSPRLNKIWPAASIASPRFAVIDGPREIGEAVEQIRQTIRKKDGHLHDVNRSLSEISGPFLSILLLDPYHFVSSSS